MKPDVDRRLGLGALAACLLGAADPYAALWQDVRALEARGALAKAAEALAQASARWPDDHDLKLELAWLEARQGRDEAAARAYAAALALSPEDAVARLGLGLSLARLGRCDEARPHLVGDGPEASSARERCAAAALRVHPVVAASVVSFGDNPLRSSGRALLGGADVTWRGWLAGARLRHLVLSPPAGSTRGDWAQDELYLDAGAGSASGGLTLHYALVVDGSGVQGTSHHLGASARRSGQGGRLPGDLFLDVAASVYDDLVLGRLAPAWRLPLGVGFSATPAVALSVTGEEALAAGRLTLAFERGRLGVWVGGKLGDELRPALLGSATVVNASEPVVGGAFAGASLQLGPIGLGAGWSLDRLRRTSGTGSDDAHTWTLALSGRF